MADNAADKTRASMGRMLGERRGKGNAVFASSFGRATLNQFKKCGLTQARFETVEQRAVGEQAGGAVSKGIIQAQILA